MKRVTLSFLVRKEGNQRIEDDPVTTPYHPNVSEVMFHITFVERC